MRRTLLSFRARTWVAPLAAALLFLVDCGGNGPSTPAAGGGHAGAALAGAAGSAGRGSGGLPTSGGSAGVGGAGRSGSAATPNLPGGGSGGTHGGAPGAVAGGGAGAGASSTATGGAAAAGGTATGGGGGLSGGAPGGGTAGLTNAGGTTGGNTSSGGAAGAPVAPSFILGADISSIQEAVDRGTRYADTDGTEKTMLQILKAHGFNYIRLRAFVEPDAEYGYARGTGGTCAKAEAYCDTAHTVEFAQQIKAEGMGFLLDLHYSDTWADPGKQITPAAWRDATSIADLANRVSTYTTEILNTLIAAGARPDMVQVGNEITPGMLIHVPNSSTDCYGNGATANAIGGSSSNWNDLATLLKAGTEAVRAVDPSIRIVLHIENTDDLAGARWWVDNAMSRDIDFDVLGLSCYTAFQGSPAVWRNTFEALADDYPELEFAIAEYNPERTEANRVMLELPDGRGLGTFFWEPSQSGSWGDSMFTSTGGVMRANSADFAEFDALKTELGL
jgi:arabinogalactan endo-1,4-beta-galactosidase